ncbi:HlyD family type I secretion periplasmic adaptor subunit [Ralstonia solanacearum]|uniref:HlyD family type I secretion periplasmic adaptor subunit n=1 Tax=Ralstonia solanacearum TaxID=305 RepID=UPI001E5A44AE|nr:HlyD family type I secretion periplasmic adaptor subunit [Ralstonia solanacearum]
MEFLPAHLELIESPPHPVPRLTMALVALIAIATLLVAVLGVLDIVVVAKGRIVPNVRVQVVQPALTGVVRRILVKDGDRVAKGQSLLELDATQAAADLHKAEVSRVSSGLAAARAQALLGAVETGKVPRIPSVEGASDTEQVLAQRFVDGAYAEYRDRLSVATANLHKRQAELATTQREVEKLRATVPISKREARDYKELAVEHFVAEHDYLGKEKAAIELEQDLAAQVSHASELAASLAEQKATIEAIGSQFKREQLDALDKATQQFNKDREDETKAVTRERLLTIFAPTAGTIQQLSVHTLGGVVTTAQALMEVVPDDVLEVEARIENKDVAFVETGQSAAVKVEAFPYLRYGYLNGVVVGVSNSAAADRDKRSSPGFAVHIRIPVSQIEANGKLVSLTPGMEVSAEIKTGKRSVASYFLDPLLQASRESLRER